LENTTYHRIHEKDVILGNTIFVSLPSHPNAGKLLSALLTFTPLETTQSTILLQDAKGKMVSGSSDESWLLKSML